MYCEMPEIRIQEVSRMARSHHSIVFDFKEAICQAGKLDEIADRMSGLTNRDFENTLNLTALSWQSDNSAKYIGKGRALKEKMNHTQEELHKTASAIREIAQIVYDAEMEAWERAHKRD